MQKSLKHYFWLLGNLYSYLFGRPILSGFHHGLIALSLHGLGYDNPRFSGERWFIENVLAAYPIHLCMDIGANTGKYTYMLDHSLSCTIYAIEPLSSSFLELKKSIGNKKNIHAVKTAFSNFEGTSTIYSDKENSENATLDKSLLGSLRIEEEIEVTTFDTFVKKNALERVDFVKIDTEGFEKEVLLGMQKTLQQGLKPAFIQLEFNIYHLYRHSTLREIATLLPEYEFYRLLPQGWIEIDPERAIDNIYKFSNIVAKLKNNYLERIL